MHGTAECISRLDCRYQFCHSCLMIPNSVFKMKHNIMVAVSGNLIRLLGTVGFVVLQHIGCQNQRTEQNHLYEISFKSNEVSRTIYISILFYTWKYVCVFRAVSQSARENYDVERKENGRRSRQTKDSPKVFITLLRQVRSAFAGNDNTKSSSTTIPIQSKASA